MNTKKSIQVINTLIEINNDRIEGYQTASAETTDNALLSLFHHFISSSNQCREELAAEVTQLGGIVEAGTSQDGKFFRPWAELRAALNNNDRKSVLKACEYGEDKVLDGYNNILTNDVDFLTIEQHKMIYKQYVLLKSAHDQIRSVRDMELTY
ncbi:MAG: PA2169 family four-helix-bundle protein [Chitinophagaceae bacterium]|nr:PA2169 family four-helix-bundle protein [Chitinophagaceae bacterium]